MAKLTSMITVTKSFLPPIEEYMHQVQRAYDNQWLTNRGELVRELETKISTYLRLTNTKMLNTNNGTTPLQIALKCLGENGEIITTPLSYVATTAAIVWENCSPVFVDINPDYLTIDETKIEAAITDKTTCILATHVYGNPCNVEEIDRIAKKHNLKVIYDAAHCFGVKYKGKSIFEYGDVSTCSFHATKIFHTGEGGALFCKNEKLFDELFYRHNFGHDGPINFHGLGINGKMSELSAAMGLSVLPYMDLISSRRKVVADYYNDHIDFHRFQKLNLRNNINWNYSYYPIIFKTEKELIIVKQNLIESEIIPRRYFNPSLNTINYVSNVKMPVSEKIANTVLCLPLHHDLKTKTLKKITNMLNLL
jgi:dTDP-4-amino-4,6-dideoxygalactose transaminase